jgi:uncharacterized membrane protein YfcA
MTATVIAALVIGVSLGLLGSGGSILTVPALVYALGHAEKPAIAESLGIVGVLAALGAARSQWAGDVVWRSVLLFGLPGVLGTYGGAWLSQWVPGAVQLLLFAATMLLAAGLMARKPVERHANASPHPAWQVVLEGVAVGVLTGLVGVGGGFLIVPALTLLGGLPIRQAVGTSLVVIAAKSFAGFGKYLQLLSVSGLGVDWTAMAWFVVLGSLGTFAGGMLGARLPQATLRRAFAAFLVVMGLFVIAKEAPKLASPAAEAATVVQLSGQLTLKGMEPCRFEP